MSAGKGVPLKRVVSAPEFAHYPEVWHLSPIVDTGELLFFSGQTGFHPGGFVDPDPERQFHDVFKFLESNLRAANLSLADVVEMTSYHVDMQQHMQTFLAIKDEYIVAPYPAWTAIGVSGLMTEGTLLEIRVIANRSK
jgi:enamine deaminase RidA (YjgF/YER057c/UK114 family)